MCRNYLLHAELGTLLVLQQEGPYALRETVKQKGSLSVRAPGTWLVSVGPGAQHAWRLGDPVGVL